MFLPEYDPAYDPLDHLDRMRVPVVRHRLDGHNAIWVPERTMVIVDRGLRADLLRPTLAHECDHVVHGDPGGHHPRNEARANLHSALRLIDPAQWDALTPIHSDYDYICLELGITRRQFRAYHEHRQRLTGSRARIERIGSSIYTNPRHGAGQWEQKVSA